MKNLFSILLFALPFLANAQVSYRIDQVSDSSFYLVEIVTTAPTAEKPVAETKEFPQRFNTKDQLVAYVQYLKKQAKEYRDQAKNNLDLAPRMESAATQIEALIPRVGSKPNDPIPNPKQKKSKNKG